MSQEGYQILGGDFNVNKPLLYYQIHGRPAFSYGDIQVQPNQKILTDGKAMLWMDGSLNIDTECYGGCSAACMRSCSGESCCMNEFSGVGKLSVGFDMPGDMLAFGVTPGNGWMLCKAAFVAGTNNLKVSSQFSGCIPCLCTDQGLFLTTVEIDPEKGGDQGVFLAGSYGMLERHDVPQGKKMYVANGNFFACHQQRNLEVSLIGGLTNFCFAAGWKSIVLEFQGPCTVYTQSRNPQDLRKMQTQAQRQQEQKQGQQGGDGGGNPGQ